MHELAVCQGLLREVARVARAHGSRRVAAVRVAVGPLSGVEAPLLERAFSIARAGTLAEGARLDVEATDIVVRCGSCGSQSRATINRLVCGVCGGWQVTLVSGDELLLKSLELETDDEETAAGAG